MGLGLPKLLDYRCLKTFKPILYYIEPHIYLSATDRYAAYWYYFLRSCQNATADAAATLSESTPCAIGMRAT